MICNALRVAMIPGMIAGQLQTAQTSQPPQSAHFTKPATSRRINIFSAHKQQINNTQTSSTFTTSTSLVSVSSSNNADEFHEVPLCSVINSKDVPTNQPVLQVARSVSAHAAQNKPSYCESSCIIQ